MGETFWHLSVILLLLLPLLLLLLGHHDGTAALIVAVHNVIAVKVVVVIAKWIDQDFGNLVVADEYKTSQYHVENLEPAKVENELEQ